MNIIDLKTYFSKINYDIDKYRDQINLINKLTKTRSNGGNTRQYNINEINEIMKYNNHNIESYGMEQPFLINALCKYYNIEKYIEIGTGRGTSAYSTCILDNIIQVDTLDILNFNDKNNWAINFIPYSNISLQNLYNLLPFNEKSKINFHCSNSKNFDYNIFEENYGAAFIDGCHDNYDIIMNDFIQCNKLVKDNGIIIMDDYGLFQTVTNVINDIYDKYKDKYKFTLIEFRGHLFDQNKKEKNKGIVLIEK